MLERLENIKAELAQQDELMESKLLENQASEMMELKKHIKDLELQNDAIKQQNEFLKGPMDDIQSTLKFLVQAKENVAIDVETGL
ncbi:Aste57867_22870 [Aphanomyces stellatus]|uniref:Aste57867_22870 protein n=1 Tax=Aphanomyces stellatus TaxID=120398 RepID=A0A485LLQ5_9STRA|nr:hypothetical protein As57867_022799 [Aphanomyces stellatus]VFT99520.1 Aste57867_22870 [Aphanomyces stellatus]